MIQIEKQDLLDLVHWARRYCDGRSTYAPHTFNVIYRKLRSLNPDAMRADSFDQTLKDDGTYWPFAHDGMFDPVNNVGWDARPRENLIKEK